MLSVAPVADPGYYLGGGHGCGVEPMGSAAADYFEEAQEHGEPPGRWAFRGSNPLGLTGEIVAGQKSGATLRTLLELKDPRTGEYLSGRKPQEFRTVKQRVAEFRRSHPHATPEQVADCKRRSEADQRHARPAWDLTFSAPKSWSVLHAAYLAAGMTREAEQLWEALEAGIDAALDQLYEEVATVRRGPQGPRDPGTGKVTGEYVPVDNLIFAKFRHHQSRERDPQLHMHVMTLAKAMAGDTWRALYSPALLRSRHMLNETFLRVAEAHAAEHMGIPFVTRPDGVAREIDGVSEQVRDLFSSRVRQLDDHAQELLDAWELKYQRKAPERVRWRIRQHANRKSRRAKDREARPVGEQLAEWERLAAAETDTSLTEVVEEVGWRTVPGGMTPVPAEFDPAEVIAQAVAELTDATSNRDQLYAAISRRLPDMLGLPAGEVRGLLGKLTADALGSPLIVTTEAAPVVSVPASLRNPRTGRSRWEPPTPVRFTTATHLRMEDAAVTRLDHRGARVVPGELVSRVLAGTGTGEDQEAAVRAIVSSGYRLSLVDAPAGSGKSYMIKRLSDVAEQSHGAPVTVLTLSEIAAEVVRGEGIGLAFNTARFLNYRRRVAEGLPVSDTEGMQYALPRGGILVIDEANTLDTRQLTEVLGEADAAGMQVVMVGDTRQVDAVDGGGAFSLLVEEAERRGRPAAQLTEVRRFSSQWEADASRRVRAGDVTAITEYETRGRIIDHADPERVLDAVVGGFVRDHLAGRDTVVVTGSEEEAAQVSDRVRARLIRHGHVQGDGVPLRDQTHAGVGDLIQTRRNNRALGVGVLNRRTWRVVGTVPGGGLEVQQRGDRDAAGEWTWGATQPLPAEYVKAHVVLAYASTVHAVEGRTTDTGHLLVTPGMGLSQVYPGWTRGRDGNWVYVITEPSPELEAARAKVTALEHRWAHADPEGREALAPVLATARVEVGRARSHAETGTARLAGILTTDDHRPAARVEIRREAERQQSLAHLGPQWEAGVRETRAVTHREHIIAVLGAEAPLVLEDSRSGRLFSLLRSAELRGHETHELLAGAMVRPDGSPWPLTGTRNPLSALYARVEDRIAVGPRTAPIPVTFERRVPEITLGDRENERRAVTRAFGAAMDDRTAVLAQALAENPEPWALRALGPVPADPVARGGWIGRAALAAAYRERYGITEQRTEIGPRPSHRDPERAWHWDLAARGIGMPDHERDLAGQPVGELLNRVQDWDRRLASLPRNVDEDLQAAHALAVAADERVIEARTAGHPTAALEADRDVLTERVRVLEEVALVRAMGLDRYAGVQEKADEARAELGRREEIEAARAGEPLDRDPEPEEEPEPEPEPVRPDPEVEVHRAVYERLGRYVGDDPVPEFGTREWLELGDDDPRKELAVSAAAAAYWRLGDPVDRERAELRDRLEAATAVIGSSPDADVDPEHLAAVHAWTVDHERIGAPAYATPEWAAADDPGRLAGETAAALGWWALGDAPTEERVQAAEERAAAITISQALVADRHAARQEAVADRAAANREERERLAALDAVEPGPDPGDVPPLDNTPEPAAWAAAEPWPELPSEPAPLPPEPGPEPGDVTPDLGADPGDEDDRAEPGEAVEEVVPAGHGLPAADEPAEPGRDEVEEPGEPEADPAHQGGHEDVEPELAEEVEHEPEATEPAEDPAEAEAEARFQAGLEWTLARAAEEAEPDPEPEPEDDEPEPEPDEPEGQAAADPDPEPAREETEPDPEPEPTTPPVPADEDPELIADRETAARAYDELREPEEVEPEPEPAEEEEPVPDPPEPDPDPEPEPEPEPEPVGADDY